MTTRIQWIPYALTHSQVSNLILPTSGRPLLSEYQYQQCNIHSSFICNSQNSQTHRPHYNPTDIVASCSLDCHAILTTLCCLGSTKVPGVQPWADWMKSAGVDRSGRVLLKATK
ncbi:hypothetical protein PGT21_006098 [Puccinia graminis f. sp. tritici]|uniref:Uncharacterized protein n=1 Tax=Puccinia graminis f. sp. tritici TaxID=56615 RepID=A0A5B0QEL6_PUCGR|nr:hypothetical protein PGT21_006098 [Puccinia graminis f. sp. tritici]